MCATLVVWSCWALAALVGFLVVGNLAIVAAWQWQSRSFEAGAPPVVDVAKFEVVDAKLWRGAAPTKDSYRDLAAGGVTTVVDLRAGADLSIDRQLLSEPGVRPVQIPMRDGQAPTEARRGDGPALQDPHRAVADDRPLQVLGQPAGERGGAGRDAGQRVGQPRTSSTDVHWPGWDDSPPSAPVDEERTTTARRPSESLRHPASRAARSPRPAAVVRTMPGSTGRPAARLRASAAALAPVTPGSVAIGPSSPTTAGGTSFRRWGSRWSTHRPPGSTFPPDVRGPAPGGRCRQDLVRTLHQIGAPTPGVAPLRARAWPPR